jgi:hypothetical protein
MKKHDGHMGDRFMRSVILSDARLSEAMECESKDPEND